MVAYINVYYRYTYHFYTIKTEEYRGNGADQSTPNRRDDDKICIHCRMGASCEFHIIQAWQTWKCDKYQKDGGSDG